MSSSQLKKAAPVKPPPPTRAGAAFAKIEPELAALDPAELAVINIDIPNAVSMVLGVLPNLMLLRAQIAGELPKHPVILLDNLENYALGAWYAHLLALPPGGPDNPVKTLLDEAAPLRANLLNDAEALANRGIFDAKVVGAIRADYGNVDTANDLVALSALFTMNWTTVSGRTAATLKEVRRAGELGPLLLAALGVREHGAAPGPVEAKDRRARAFTLFTRAYDACQRAVVYLRWEHGDADEIAPSLYKGRGGRGSKSSTDGETGEEQVPGKDPDESK